MELSHSIYVNDEFSNCVVNTNTAPFPHMDSPIHIWDRSHAHLREFGANQFAF